MLRIGQRSYELVRGASQILVSIGGRRRKADEQQWMIDAHYVPSAEDPGGGDGDDWEYLRLTIHPFGFRIPDWRELTKLRVECLEDPPADFILLHVNLENLLAGYPHHRDSAQTVAPGDLKLRRSGGYHFIWEFDGEYKTEDGVQELTVLDELPFGQATVYPSVNVKDPVVAGRAIAAREIKLTEMAGSHVLGPDWRREKETAAPLDSYHHVTLRTPWRNAER